MGTLPSLPHFTFNSFAIRLAIVTAATRRGCVTPIIPGLGLFLSPKPDSYKNCGSCVVFPDPVSPHNMTNKLLLIASTISCSIPQTGSSILSFLYFWVALDGNEKCSLLGHFKLLLFLLRLWKALLALGSETLGSGSNLVA